MIQTTGKVTEVCKSSQLEDQITVLIATPSPNGSEAARSLEWFVPTGTVKVGTTLKLAFVE
jgi:hypothetical protein